MGLAEGLDDRLRPVAAPVPSVHVWELDLAPRPSDPELAGLDDEDTGRIATLGQDDAARLLARRVLLRVAVAAVSGCHPAAVRMRSAEGPRTVQAGDRGRWYASVSSSGERGLLGLAGRPVGVDVERRPGPPDALLVSRELLAEAEHAWIVRGGASGPERFLDTWVRKEAVVKCTGEGMSRDLRSFVVDAASASAAVLTPDGTETAIRTYALPVPGTAAALAVATTSPALVG